MASLKKQVPFDSPRPSSGSLRAGSSLRSGWQSLGTGPWSCWLARRCHSFVSHPSPISRRVAPAAFQKQVLRCAQD